jgi:hypothetical protein
VNTIGLRPAASDRLRSRRAVLIAATTLAAAAAGATLGATLRGDPAAVPGAAVRLEEGPVRLTLPQGWTASTGHSAIPGLERGRVIRGPLSDVTVAVGPVESGTLLPTAVAARVEAERPRITAGPVRMWGYDLRLPRGRAAAVLTAPTTAGVVTIACQAEAAMLDWAAEDCDEIAARLRLQPPAAWIALRPDTALRLGLPPIVRQLNQRREAARAALGRTTSPEPRRAAAASLGDAYAEAARTITPLVDGTRRDLPRRLARISRAYDALGAASARRRPVRARRAGAAIARGERHLQRTLIALSR